MSVIAKDGRLQLAPPVATVRLGAFSAGHGYEACWSDRMQMTGQVECKRVVNWSAISHTLKDRREKAAIAARIFRLANGLPSDVSPAGQGVGELRIHYDPGYRVYFQQCGTEIVILLCG